MTHALTCRQVIAVLMEHLDGSLAPAARRDVDAHLAACPRCEEFVRAYQATSGVVRRATATPATRPTVKRLCEAAVRAAGQARRPSKPRR